MNARQSKKEGWPNPSGFVVGFLRLVNSLLDRYSPPTNQPSLTMLTTNIHELAARTSQDFLAQQQQMDRNWRRMDGDLRKLEIQARLLYHQLYTAKAALVQDSLPMQRTVEPVVPSAKPESITQTLAPMETEFPVPDSSPEEATPVKTVAMDERYAKFFRLLAIGAPVAQLKQRMQMEGLDARLLE